MRALPHGAAKHLKRVFPSFSYEG
ncbi:protein of unknown function [Streptomyces sp. KY75]|nr:protein of unknown function [Streptomyces sp. KY75]